MKVLAIMSMLMMGCGTAWAKTGSAIDSELAKAEEHLAHGELYMARKLAQKVLSKDKENPRGQQLMAHVLDQEISRRMEVFKDTVPEEFTKSEKNDEIRTWLERAKGFMAIRQYDQATLAAEKVFDYDPENIEASRLLDEIRGYAIKEGKEEVLLAQQIARDESKQRISLYEKQAQESVSKGMWGMARLATEKILLLDPDNDKALNMQKQIQRQRQTSRENL